MRIPRTLLLTSTPPGDGSVGEVFLRDLCRYYPKDRLCCFAVTSPAYAVGVPSPELEWLPIIVRQLPPEQVFGPLTRRLGSLISFLTYQTVGRIRLSPLIGEAVRFGEQHGVELVWAVLNSPSTIRMATQVASRLRVRMVSLIWDPPETLALNRGFDRFSRRALLREFADVLHTSVGYGVASEGMRDEYREQYGIESVVMTRGINARLWRVTAGMPDDSAPFIIGFAGSMYARQEWQALLAALSSIGWRLEDREIMMRVMGNRLDLRAKGDKMRVEYWGWRSTEETIELMSQVHVAYLPYWFDPLYSTSVRLCFPDKLITYLAAGRPVLYHGPEDSSPARFLARYPVGLCCHSLEPSMIVETLHRFVVDQNLYTRAASACQAALDAEFSPGVIRRRFAELMGIEESDLPVISNTV